MCWTKVITPWGYQGSKILYSSLSSSTQRALNTSCIHEFTLIACEACGENKYWKDSPLTQNYNFLIKI